MNKLKILKILAKREEYLKFRQKELKQSDMDYNFMINHISGQLSEVAFISQIIYCIEEEENEIK